jgi:hypothetical protein
MHQSLRVKNKYCVAKWDVEVNNLPSKENNMESPTHDHVG